MKRNLSMPPLIEWPDSSGWIRAVPLEGAGPRFESGSDSRSPGNAGASVRTHLNRLRSSRDGLAWSTFHKPFPRGWAEKSACGKTDDRVS